MIAGTFTAEPRSSSSAWTDQLTTDAHVDAFCSYLRENGETFLKVTLSLRCVHVPLLLRWVKGDDTQTHHSLSDAVWDLHVLGGDEPREVLEALHQLELPAELRAEEEEQDGEMRKRSQRKAEESASVKR